MLKNKEKQKPESSDALPLPVQPMATPPKWCESFESLLSDPRGKEAFTEFLHKEYSQENMIFWLSCCQYEAADEAERKNIAIAIYDRHLAGEVSKEPVNVDSAALNYVKTHLCEAPEHLFKTAKHQIFTLMKTDKYQRFLASELSKCPIDSLNPEPKTENQEAASRTLPGQKVEKPSSLAEGINEDGKDENYEMSRDKNPCHDISPDIEVCSSSGQELNVEHNNNHVEKSKTYAPEEDNLEPLKDDKTNGRESLDVGSKKSYNSSERRSRSIEDTTTSKNLLAHEEYEPNENAIPSRIRKKRNSLYLLKRLSVSLDQMIVLEESGLHSTNHSKICQLSELLEDKETADEEIKKFIDSVETLQSFTP
ncbi:hypothetical protein EB796_022466 [Bugula neritina]|uniref:RGS domain-containing protein n=1 Tax=Bugula neritina TaxID=10212 RepID=A0A7J7IZK7_BUGNE|nr:hypothetical protein EB796_022466 [Bugula neritina]